MNEQLLYLQAALAQIATWWQQAINENATLRQRNSDLETKVSKLEKKDATISNSKPVPSN